MSILPDGFTTLTLARNKLWDMAQCKTPDATSSGMETLKGRESV